MVFNEVCDDLEREGYEVQSFLVPAASVGAPHQRQRIWFVAHSNDKGRSGEFREVQKENGEISKRNNDSEPSNSNNTNATNSNQVGFSDKMDNRQLERRRFNKSYKQNAWDSFPTVSPICGGDDGLPKELDNITFSKWRKESIKGYGNAIVPQVAHEIFKAIQKIEDVRVS